MTTTVVMTYDSLVADIQSYLERNDTQTLDKIPTFIMLAEQVIASQIKFLGNLTVNTSTMTLGDPVISKPARWHKTPKPQNPKTPHYVVEIEVINHTMFCW